MNSALLMRAEAEARREGGRDGWGGEVEVFEWVCWEVEGWEGFGGEE